MKTQGSGNFMKSVKKSRELSLSILLVIIVAVFSFSTSPVQAAYLKNVPQTLLQPDGSTLKCFATGDEYYNWLHDANDFTIIQDSVTGFYVYAVRSGDKLVPTTIIAGKMDPVAAGLQPGQNIDVDQVVNLTHKLFKVPALKGGSSVLTTGTINNIVIFIRFADQNEFTEPVSKYSVAFNATGSPSMFEYFKEVSGSQLTINTSFFPQNGGNTVVSYQNTQNRNYYCKYNAVSNPAGYQNETERSSREMTLLRDATDAVKSQIESTGLNYDNDNNGQIDNVCYIVEGNTDGWSELLWPHMWALYYYNVTIGGAKVWNYNFQIADVFGVHVLCHEMSHSLGFPDLYRYTNNTINPVGPWDVMSSITNPPQHQTVYTKEKYGHWVSSIPEITTGGTFTLNPVATDPFAAYKIVSPNSTSEYFVVEYRKTTGMFDAQLLGSGLIIYRVNPSINGNSYGPPDEVYICRPNGTTTNTGDLAQAFYSSNAGRTSFGGSSATSCFLSNGAPGGFEINNIGTAGESITFNVSFGNTPPALSLTPANREVPAQGGTASFAVSNTGGGSMNWTSSVTSGNSWAHISAGTSGTNTGNISVTVDANTDNNSRTAIITVIAPGATGSPKTISIVQAASQAVLDVTPATRSLDYTSGSVSFTVSNTGGGTLRWSTSVTSGSSWAQISSGSTGSNTGSIQVSVSANTTAAARTASLTVTAEGVSGSKTITIVQAANESVMNAGPQSQTISSGSASTSFAVANTGNGTLSWTATVSSGASWAHITSGSNGTNTGTVMVLADANPENAKRSAIVTVTDVSGKTSPINLTINQDANESVLTVTPEQRTIDFNSSTLTFQVNNAGGGSIDWTASVSEGSAWASIRSGAGGTNSGTITVEVEANKGMASRNAVITISKAGTTDGAKSVTITQGGNETVLTAGPALQNISLRGSTTTFAVSNTGNGTLSWSAAISSGSTWVHITSGNKGSNSGTIQVSADPNPDNTPRSATITVTDDAGVCSPKTLTIQQEANPSVLLVTPTLREINFNNQTLTFTVSNTGGGSMNWNSAVTSGSSWATISSGSAGINDGTITVAVEANIGAPRTATITVISPEYIGGQITLSIVQSARLVALEIDPDLQTIGFSGGTLNFGVSISGEGDVNWSSVIDSKDSWIHIISGTEGSNNGTITVQVDENPGGSRTSHIRVTSVGPNPVEKTLTITQDISNGINSIQTDNRLNVYPNPFDNQCTVQVDGYNGSTVKLEVFNMNGQLEFSQALDQERTLINLSGMSQGIYLFRVLSETSILSQRRVVKN